MVESHLAYPMAQVVVSFAEEGNWGANWACDGLFFMFACTAFAPMHPGSSTLEDLTHRKLLMCVRAPEGHSSTRYASNTRARVFIKETECRAEFCTAGQSVSPADKECFTTKHSNVISTTQGEERCTAVMHGMPPPHPLTRPSRRLWARSIDRPVGI